MDAEPQLIDETENEKEMHDKGIKKYYDKTRAAQKQGRESGTKYGQKLLEEVMDSMVPLITAFRRQRGGFNLVKDKIADLSPEKVAFLTGKIILDCITEKAKLTGSAIRIGAALQDELFFSIWRNDNNPKHRRLLKKVVKDLERRGVNAHHMKGVLKHEAEKAGILYDFWTTSERLQVGSKMLDLFITATGLVEVVTIKERAKRRCDLIIPTEKARRCIERVNGESAISAPEFMPMVIPPKDWDSPYGGGYFTEYIHAPQAVDERGVFVKECPPRPLSIMKARLQHQRVYLEELANRDLSTVYTAINGIQQTAWRINTPVLATLQGLIDLRSEQAGLPAREEAPLPTKPIDIETNKESRREWKRAARAVRDENNRRASKVIMLDKILYVAKRYEQEPAIYFPHQMDFRGRIYAVPLFLNPQGPDVAKSLLTFANGKPINDQKSADWLAIHGANVFGYDKHSLQDRIKWVKDNERLILAAADDPIEHLGWWSKADKPWQFLAFCFEWHGFKKHGFGFESSLPVALDGSCNGLQHFSALLRDEIGGAAVNLTPAAVPQDIYQVVSDKVVLRLRELAAQGNKIAQLWLTFGLDRKGTKRCVMVLPYGGTKYAFRKYIREYMEEKIASGKPNPFGWKPSIFGRKEVPNEPVAIMADLIMEAIGSTVVAAINAMSWLRETARTLADEGLPVIWTTPVGLPVQQFYPKFKVKRCSTTIHGKCRMLNLRNALPLIDAYDQANGISPNFIHSLDAACLMYTVEGCLKVGVDSFAMVHDSYATVAADTQKLSIYLRCAFLKTYSDDVLAKFKHEVSQVLSEGVTLPELPKKGSLDLRQVLKSDFFFA